MTPPIAYINGQFLPLVDARVSITDRGFIYGDGVFETMRAYGGQVFRIEEHLQRLDRSAQAIFLELPESTAKLQGIVNETLRKNSFTNAIVRIQVTRGENIHPVTMSKGNPPTLTITVQPYEALPENFYREGVTVALIPDSAPRIPGLNQQIKSTNFLPHIMVRKLAQQQGAWDGIMLDSQGHICDASTSNVFMVHANHLKTPPLNEYVLAGITRKEVIRLASEQNLPCTEVNLTANDLKQADEVFLTNTGIEVLPVVEVDGQKIGTGQPGPWSQKIHQEFLKSVASSRG